jgi:hypothetical protein
LPRDWPGHAPAQAPAPHPPPAAPRRGEPPRPPLKLPPLPLLPLLLLLAAWPPGPGPRPAAAQQPMPFLGNGDFAPPSEGSGGAVDVHVSVFVDRMLRIDDREYEFEVRGGAGFEVGDGGFEVGVGGAARRRRRGLRGALAWTRVVCVGGCTFVCVQVFYVYVHVHVHV